MKIGSKVNLKKQSSLICKEHNKVGQIIGIRLNNQIRVHLLRLFDTTNQDNFEINHTRFHKKE